MGKIIRRGLAALTVCGLAAALLAAIAIYRTMVLPAALPGGGPVAVRIPPGSTAGEAASILADAGVIRRRELLLAVLKAWGATGRVKAGPYRFTEPVSVVDVARKLLEGEVELVPLLVREGADRWDIAAAFEAAGVCDGPALLHAIQDPSPVRELDPKAVDLEGYLFPDTYFVGHGDGAADVVRMMTDRFKEKFKPEWTARASAMGMTVRETVILASIIEKETGDPEERAVISSVFHNRLKRGFRLDSDPTVIYALKLRGAFDGNLKRPHLKDPSPYNTYTHRGLPPGPVGNPGTESLKAALFPAKTNYLYFVSMNNGKHHFSSTLKEHNAAVHKYQKAYWREVWRRERRK